MPRHIDRALRCRGAIGVPAHTIGQHQQLTLVSAKPFSTVLIVLPIPQQAYEIAARFGRLWLGVYTRGPLQSSQATMAAYPISSMTGYARGRCDSPAGELQLELRTVNHRYLDISLRVPEELRALENPLRAKLKSGLGRGKVEAYVRLRSATDEAAALDINRAALAQLATAVRDVEGEFPEAIRVDPVAILRWPGVLRDSDMDMSAMSQAFSRLADETIAELQSARRDEGQRMAEVIAARLDSIESLVEQVQVRLPVQAQLWREKLEQRMVEMTDMEIERREQALVQFVQRLDVDEEIERLKSHVAAVRAELGNSEPVGRKLDFFMQEFNREANTLGSKSMDAELTRLAVELKVVIEQMREQVQNIE